ncbi:putative lipase atg15 [Mortierella sp. GBA43]|nr:putative lipase atg15 [Mortierella sp. GBA43]
MALDLTHGDVALSELASGASHTHRVKVKATTALRPADPSYRKQGFRSPGMSLAPDFWTSEPIPAPDVTDKETVIQFAKLNYNAYSEVGDAGCVDRTWRPVCDCNTEGYNCDQKCVEQSVNSEEVYYDMAMALHDTTQDLYPNATVWMTGHSLGGGLASLVGLTFGTPTVTFQMPGDRLAAQRLHLPMPPAIDWNDIPLFHFGHTADPVFQGVCNGRTSTCYLSGFAMESKCHTGRTCVYDPVKEDNWGVDIRKHRLMDTIEGVLKVKEVPVCKVEEDCEDCKDWTFKDDDEEEDTD